LVRLNSASRPLLVAEAALMSMLVTMNLLWLR
jgi:hypothetical protein